MTVAVIIANVPHSLYILSTRELLEQTVARQSDYDIDSKREPPHTPSMRVHAIFFAKKVNSLASRSKSVESKTLVEGIYDPAQPSTGFLVFYHHLHLHHQSYFHAFAATSTGSGQFKYSLETALLLSCPQGAILCRWLCDQASPLIVHHPRGFIESWPLRLPTQACLPRSFFTAVLPPELLLIFPQ